MVRFLVEVKNNGTWVPEQILCQFTEHRTALIHLAHIAQRRGRSLNDFRMKRLMTADAIAEAKQAIYRAQDRRR